MVSVSGSGLNEIDERCCQTKANSAVKANDSAVAVGYEQVRR